METPDAALIRDVLAGDAEAFRSLVERYQDTVYALALRIVRDPHLAQDVAQEAFVAAYEKLAQLRQPERFAAWLRGIASNAARRALRRRKRERAAIDRLTAQAGRAGAEAARAPEADAGALRSEILAIVDGLSETLRLPVLLCYLGEMPTDAAARFLGVRPGTLRKRLHDAKRKLQRGIVERAEQALAALRLPEDFAQRCLCGCARSQRTQGRGKEGRREDPEG